MNDEKVVNNPEISADTTPQEETTNIVDILEAAKAENVELQDKYLRLAAEMENLRRRTDREIQDIKVYSISSFARDMLGVSDNLSRALDAIPLDIKETADVGLKALIEGVEMTKRSMMSALESHGIRKTEAEGKKFNPNCHQAMFEEPNEEIPNNTVIKVIQEGYTIGKRVLRPAMVGVSKGGPKFQPEKETSIPTTQSEEKNPDTDLEKP